MPFLCRSLVLLLWEIALIQLQMNCVACCAFIPGAISQVDCFQAQDFTWLKSALVFLDRIASHRVASHRITPYRIL